MHRAGRVRTNTTTQHKVSFLINIPIRFAWTKDSVASIFLRFEPKNNLVTVNVFVHTCT